MTQTFRLIDRPHGPRMVELCLDGNVITTTHGPLAGPHRSSRIEYPDDAQAQKVLADRLYLLQKRGYQLGEHHPGLIARIAAEPDEVEHYLVYADWLLERGDPRGELIRVMEGLERLPGDPELERSLAALWAQHDLRFRPLGWAQLDLQWRWGFVESVSLDFRLVPGGPYETPEYVRGTITNVFRHPSGRFIRRARAGYRTFALRPDTTGNPLVLERVR